MHPNSGSIDSIKFRQLICLDSFWMVLCLDRIYLTLDYEIVLHQLLAEVEVRYVELPYTHL